MKITWSPLVAGGSGRTADAVVGNWKGISYVRKFVVPTNPKSAAQVIQRGYMSRMSPWWRSLPSDLTALINTLAVGQKMSGFNLSTKRNLTDLKAAAAPGLVPGNPDAAALLTVVDGAGGTDAEIDITWAAGAAIATHFVHPFTCPVDPDEAEKEEADAWTMYGTPTLVSAGSIAAIPVTFVAKAYYVACLVGDTNDLATCTVLSGGTAKEITSGETP